MERKEGGGERARREGTEGMACWSHLDSENTLPCHCESKLMHSFDSLMQCQRREEERGPRREKEGESVKKGKANKGGWERE